MTTTAVRVLVPIGMLGGGVPAGTVERGIELGADIIAIDGGSTDSVRTPWARPPPRRPGPLAGA